MFKNILPKQINNNYKGSKIAIYGFYPIMVMWLFRSFTHFLSENAGLVKIASINKLPITNNIDPNNLVYLFASLWGASQLIITLLTILFFFKYRSLLPLLWLIVIFDILLRFISGFLHPLTPEYYINVPPGSLAQIPLLIYGILMFTISIKKI
tara:strand:+ start:39 stop:497 length:459 start_codon:yes stop_codon:yes gene_type:complete